MEEEIKKVGRPKKVVTKPRKERKNKTGVKAKATRLIHYRERDLKDLIKSSEGVAKRKREHLQLKLMLFQYYVIENIESEILSYGAELKKYFEYQKTMVKSKDVREELYKIIDDFNKLYGRYDFATFNEYIEFLMPPEKQFYMKRRKNKAFKEIIQTLNDTIMVPGRYELVAISMPPRTGKCLPNSELVVTPNGYKPMGEIKVNDLVASPKGKFVKVLGVYPQGRKEIYRITFDDKKYVDASLDHLWSVKSKNDRTKGNKPRILTTKDMLNNFKLENGKRNNYSIEKTKPLEFEKKNLIINPYSLGAFLGDGYCNEKSLVTINNTELDVIKNFSKGLIGEDTIKQRNYKTFDIASNHKKSNFKKGLEHYGLQNSRSYEKFIPKDYLYSDIEDRLELLRGLIDTDGFVNGCFIEYSTTSKDLANGVKWLVESLGGKCKISTRKGKYTKNGKIIETRLNYRVYFSFDNGIIPVSSEKHLKKFKVKTTNKDHFISNIEKLNQNEEMTCIYVDSEEHLFLTNHFIPTHNTQIGIRYLTWVSAKYPETSNLGASCTNDVTDSFYMGMMEIINGDARYRYNEIFPNSALVGQNSKNNSIWLGQAKRYQTIGFRSIATGVQGRYEAGKVLYCDDLVEGYETAMSIDRLDKIWNIYLSNFVNRKKEGAVEVHIGTRWSLHDPIGRLEKEHKKDTHYKFINYPALGEEDLSNFDYDDGFSTSAYRKIRERYLNQDLEHIWKAVYQNEPIEKDGAVFEKDKINYYYDIPDKIPDAKIAIIDSKNQGKDYVACSILYNYNQYWYLEDVVHSNLLPEVTTKLIADKLVKHGISMAYCESNNGGEYFAQKVVELCKEQNHFVSMATFFTSGNKMTRIITESTFIKEFFLFKHKSKYPYNSHYYTFMENVFEFNQKGTAKFDDAPDCLSLASQQIKYMIIPTISVGDRNKLGF